MIDSCTFINVLLYTIILLPLPLSVFNFYLTQHSQFALDLSEMEPVSISMTRPVNRNVVQCMG